MKFAFRPFKGKADILLINEPNQIFFESAGLYNKNFRLIKSPSQECDLSVLLTPTGLRNMVESKIEKKRRTAGYFAAYHDIVRPKLNLTFIDDDASIYEFAALKPGTPMIAVQNGWRMESNYKAFFPDRIDSPATILAFSPMEVEAIRKCGLRVKEVLPVGSVAASYVNSLPVPQNLKYDICWVSQWREGFEGTSYFSMEGMDVVHDRVVREIAKIAKKQNLRACIAGSHPTSKVEEEYFKERFPNADYFHRNSFPFSSYQLIRVSELSVGLNSACLVEALQMGKKTFVCHYSQKLSDLNLPFPEELSVKGWDFLPSEIEKKILVALDYNTEAYFSGNVHTIGQLIPPKDGQPAFQVLREKIHQALT